MQERRNRPQGYRLALLLMVANSGGIVGHAAMRLVRRAGFGLCLAALEVFPQRCAQALLLPSLLCFFRPIVHGHARPLSRSEGFVLRIEAPRQWRGARAGPVVRWICVPLTMPFNPGCKRRLRPPPLACSTPLWQGSPQRCSLLYWSNSQATRRCRSSVVEHPLGKGEVVSSILTGSTIFRTFEMAPLQRVLIAAPSSRRPRLRFLIPWQSSIRRDSKSRYRRSIPASPAIRRCRSRPSRSPPPQ